MEASVTIMISVFMVMMRKGEGLSQMGGRRRRWLIELGLEEVYGRGYWGCLLSRQDLLDLVVVRVMVTFILCYDLKLLNCPSFG